MTADPFDWQHFYNEVYTILVNHAGALERDRDRFVACAMSDGQDRWTEWRFCGDLGFGGKVWRANGRIYVSCYPEDRTKKREKILDDVNARLKAILPEEGVHGPPKAHSAFMQYRKEIYSPPEES